MKLTIVAATGGIGHQLLEQAIAAGHDVTTVVRNPNKQPGELAAQVRTVTANLANADPAALELAIAGADAVLSGLGPRPGKDPPASPRAARTPSWRRCRRPACDASWSSAPRRSAPCPHPATQHRPGMTRATGSSCATYSLP